MVAPWGGTCREVPVIAGLATRWPSAGNDVVFTRYINYPGSPYERLLGWTECMESPQIDIVDELRPHAEKATAVIDKNGYGMFADTAAAALVAGHGGAGHLCVRDRQISVTDVPPHLAAPAGGN
ncbi:hypothetical protein [Nonomuraea sp. NPDC049480]|uniref:hypothetical protein n=1 Tax=Nonomuraea sp. NPDC049480 TaxID=3364353 RepID=UPI0037AF1C4D